MIRHNVPERSAGGILGYSTSSQYVGQVVGPLTGGFIGGHFGMRAVFLGTSVLMALARRMAGCPGLEQTTLTNACVPARTAAAER